MEIRLKFSTLLTLTALMTSQYTFAECKTVMGGGCTKEDTVNVAPHMRSNNTTTTIHAKPVAPANNQNTKNTTANNTQLSKTSTKKL